MLDVRLFKSTQKHMMQSNDVESGYPSPTSLKWQDNEFCMGMRKSRPGFDLDNYVQMPIKPPPVPKYWVFAQTVIRSDMTPTVLKTRLFKMYRQMNVHVSMADSQWHWTLEYCRGPYYICADMYMFSEGSKCIVDLNLLQGDRYEWMRFVNVLKGYNVDMPSTMPVDHTSAFVQSLLQNKCVGVIGTDVLQWTGKDQTPEAVLPFLKHHDLNVVRTAMLRLSMFDCRPEDCTDIECWLSKPLLTFLEREIAKHAYSIMLKHSCL